MGHYILKHLTYQERNTTHKIRHHQIGKNREFSTDIQHETGTFNQILSTTQEYKQTKRV
jgi:hypothetical protein